MRYSYWVYMVCMFWTYCNLWNGSISSYVMKISCVVCQGSDNGCWSDGVGKCFCGGICDVIRNDFCVNYCNCYFDIYESMSVILICYTCACSGVGSWRSIWYNALCAIFCGMQVCQMVVFCLDNLLLCDHTHRTQNNVH